MLESKPTSSQHEDSKQAESAGSVCVAQTGFGAERLPGCRFEEKMLGVVACSVSKSYGTHWLTGSSAAGDPGLP